MPPTWPEKVLNWSAMEPIFSELERRLVATPHLDLAAAALVASGVESETGLARYLGTIDFLCQAITQAGPLPNTKVKRAQAVFNWLWASKPQRYLPGGSFRLTEALDNQLSPETEHVGNCLGLTLLYNALAQRLGLKVKAAHLEEAFGIGPHVFTILLAEKRTIDVENSLAHGFDYQGHRGACGREEWGDKELVADIYLSGGNSQFEGEQPEVAVASYNKALWLNPNYTKARLNRGMALSMLGREKEAKKDLS